MSLLPLVLGLVVAVVLAAIGFRRVYRESLSLKWRFVGYGALPIRVQVDEALGRIAVAQRRVDAMPALLLRAERALAEIAEARGRLTAMLAFVVAYFRGPARP